MTSLSFFLVNRVHDLINSIIPPSTFNLSRGVLRVTPVWACRAFTSSESGPPGFRAVKKLVLKLCYSRFFQSDFKNIARHDMLGLGLQLMITSIID